VIVLVLALALATTNTSTALALVPVRVRIDTVSMTSTIPAWMSRLSDLIGCAPAQALIGSVRTQAHHAAFVCLISSAAHPSMFVDV
jgi:hypothetical protein